MKKRTTTIKWKTNQGWLNDFGNGIGARTHKSKKLYTRKRKHKHENFNN